MDKIKEEIESELYLVGRLERTILIDLSILHTLSVIQTFSILINIRKNIEECLHFKDHRV